MNSDAVGHIHEGGKCMKRKLGIVVCLLLLVSLSLPLFSAGQVDQGPKVLNVWSFTDEVPKMI